MGPETGPETYPDVEFDHAPKNQHGRVSVAVLDPIDLEIPEDRAEGREQAEEEDHNKTDFLARADLELEKHRDRDDGDDDVGHNGDNGVCGERRARGEARAGGCWIPRFVYLDDVTPHQHPNRTPGEDKAWSLGRGTYRIARQDQGQRTPQVASHDGNHGDPDYPPVDAVGGSLEEPQVADQQRNLEEADAQLVDGPAGIVGARVRDEVLLWACHERESEAKLGLCTRESRHVSSRLQCESEKTKNPSTAKNMHVRTMVMIE